MAPPVTIRHHGPMDRDRQVAFFSMEIALETDIPTYSGGLGVYAGDLLRSAADLKMPVVGITLVYDNGYFFQLLDDVGGQKECQIQWDFSAELLKVPQTITIEVGGKEMKVGAWLYPIVGHTGYTVPVYLLDTNVEGNSEDQKTFTKILYDATPYQRLVQEIILGVGGIRMLEKLGFNSISRYHMNEGHSSFVTMELMARHGRDAGKVKERCMFTTHTPVPAGHDYFNYDLVRSTLGSAAVNDLIAWGCAGELNMTKLGMIFSRYVNAVSRKHGEVARQMFPDIEIDHITNGIHTMTWLHPEINALCNKYLRNIAHGPEYLAEADSIDSTELWLTHNKIKGQLLEYEKSHSWVLLDEKLLTIGFARRITEYKRPNLILRDLDRLGEICKWRAQIIMAGKTHPRDFRGKELIKEIFAASKYLWEKHRVRLVFLNNYNMDLAKLMVSGVDIWLNTPRRYQEACGTSGMKAAHNGIPNFSVLDGWWIEGHEMSGGMAGWTIGPGPSDPDASSRSDEQDANDLYQKLEKEIIPMYYDMDGKYSSEWMARVKGAIALGAYFNTHRAVKDYARKAWRMERVRRWQALD